MSRHIFRIKLLFSGFLLFVVFSFFSVAYAGNPVTPILPSDNIQDPGDPGTTWGGCGPSDSNCYVTVTSSPWLTSGSDIYYNAGNVGIGDATPVSLFTVGAGDAFRVNSSGALAAATGLTSSGTITFSNLGGGGTQCIQANNSGVISATGSACGSGGGLTIGSSGIAGGTSGRVLYDNSGVLGEMTTTGSGTILALATSPSFITPSLGVATATSINGATITSGTLNGSVTGTNTGDQTITLTGDATGSGTGSFAVNVGKINGIALSGLATGLIKNTTGTGVPSIAVAGTDYEVPITFSTGLTRTVNTVTIDSTVATLTGSQTLTNKNLSSGTNTFPTFNQNTTGSAATLATSRAIYGNNFDGSAALTQIIASTFGGTGNGFTKFSGPTASEKTFTLPDASATILTTNASVTVGQGGTGTNTFASNAILYGNGTGAIQALAVNAGATQCLMQTSSGAPTWGACGGSGGGDALVANPLSQFASTTSAQLAGVISNETGSGALVFATSPSFTTPSLGVATATSINGATITSGTLNGSVTGTNTGDQTITLTGDATGSGTGSFAVNVARINGVALSGLATGLLKNTTGTGVPSIATAGTDYEVPLTFSTGLTRSVNTITIDSTVATLTGSQTLTNKNLTSGTNTFPTFNQNTTGSAATLTTPRAIYGNNFDGSAALAQIIASTFGGTGNGFTKFSGPTITEKTFTLPDASTTILTTNATVTVGQGGTGINTLASNGILYGNGTGAVQALAVNAGAVQCLTQASSGTPAWGACGGGGGVTINTTTITSGTSGRILYDNAGVIGEMTTTGTGTVVALATSPSFTTPTLGVASATSMTIGSSAQFQIDSAGIVTSAAGLTSSGTITLSGLTTTGIVHNNSSGVLSTSLVVLGDLFTQGTATDEFCLTSETGGGALLAWQACGGGGVTSLSAIGSTPNANGATITGSVLNLEPASASFGGVVTTGTQTFAGAKTFNSDILAHTLTVGLGAGAVYRNSAFGVTVLNANTTGDANTAIGYESMLLNQGGGFNTAIGAYTLSSNVSADDNVAIGDFALNANTAAENTAIGSGALALKGGGTGNVAIGISAGYNLTDGSNNIFIGNNINPNISNTGSSQLSIGNWIYGNNGNIGVGDSTPDYRLDVVNTGLDGDIFSLTDSDGECLYNPEAGSVTVSCSSDARLKENIVDADSALLYFSNFTIRDYDVISSGSHMTGVIAQEVLLTHPELVSTGADGIYKVELPNTWKLVKAAQELDIKIKGITNLEENESGPSFVSNLRAWLANASNRVSRIFTGEICLTDADGTSECLNKAELGQLKSLLNNGSQGGGGGSPTPPTDVCSNIEGDQATMPEGYHADDTNACVANDAETPPIDEPPVVIPPTEDTPAQ